MWARASLLIHLMVVPADIVMASGMYAVVESDEAPIGIVTVADVPAGVGVGVGTVGIGEGALPPQPASASTDVRRPARQMCFISRNRRRP